ncbi:Putative ribose-phosphate pyrophosphokinase [Pseudoalteromonas holothuriae]|uniref:Ribose-phosphate pyrophosphokinase n=1 Tax=Pseudoalteromonas holothuriae TaxID=2963714 RepID=A0ABM9GI92_9GAMM|nr:phosphoribosyltransferase family protein [Pseudoalteromonas sp. CIP111951]CAH9058627.1 Putative ribose-phosphate pyrophosphokinase [Pseudoalteromonas sp. CIP111951]
MLLDWLFSKQCPCCQSALINTQGLCAHCLYDFPLFCVNQGNLLFRPDINRIITLKNCDGLFACGWYQGWLQTWLSDYKFHHRTYLKQILKQLIHYQMLQFWQSNYFTPDICFFMPLSQTRYIKRGYNQVAQTWLPSIKPYTHISLGLTRIKTTKPQSELSKKQRKDNVKNAFLVQEDIKDKKVAIIDDVITTGSTMSAAAQACIHAGAAQVWAFSTALTPLNAQ